MANDIKDVAKRLIEIRTFSDFSTKEVAEKLGIDEKEYIDYENAVKEVPINVIYRFAALMDTEPMYITSGKMPSKDDAVVVYGGNGVSVKRYDGYTFSSLAADFKHKQMNPMLVTMDPTDKPELVSHGGQELNFVLEGELRVVVGNKEYFLREGDSIYFNPQLPHAQIPMNNKSVKFLTVIND